ncbi:MAG: EamA family transporter [Paracoccaceae bacterium]
MNFLLATPAAAALLLLPGAAPRADPSGVALALAAGALTSGLGYALWYAVLPRLLPSAAALAQLTVPVIALAGGALILVEPVAPATALAAALVLGGVAIGLLFRTRGRAL